MIFDRLEKQFYDLIAAFEAEEITYSEFEYEFAAFGDNTAIAVGEELLLFGPIYQEITFSKEKMN